MKTLRRIVKFGFLIILTAGLNYQYAASQDDVLKTTVAAVMKNYSDNQKLPLHAIIVNQALQIQDKLKLMQELLDDNLIDINAQDEVGRTALNIATFYKADPAIIALLISYKADVNKPDLFNQSPLHNAIAKEEIETAQLLLNAHADPALKNDMLETPIDLARSSKTKLLFSFK